MVCTNTIVEIKSKMMRLVGNVSRMGQKTSYRVYVWNLYGKR